MQSDVLSARLVGVGEAAHGELVSWPTRVRLLRAALRQSPDEPIVVFLEQLHPFVAAMNVPGEFFVDPDGGDSHPFLIADANWSAEHLLIHENLRRLSGAGRVIFVGIDVQVGLFPHLWKALPGGEPRVDELTKRTVEKHARGFKRGNGADRNRRNTAVILSIMRELRAGAPSFYWAHNEHVAVASQNTRASREYRVEGDLLRRALPAGAYVSVLTYSPRMWNVWGAEKPRLMIEPSSTTRRFFGAPRTTRMSDLPDGMVLNDLIRSDDADWVVASPTSPKMVKNRRKKSHPVV